MAFVKYLDKNAFIKAQQQKDPYYIAYKNLQDAYNRVYDLSKTMDGVKVGTLPKYGTLNVDTIKSLAKQYNDMYINLSKNTTPTPDPSRPYITTTTPTGGLGFTVYKPLNESYKGTNTNTSTNNDLLQKYNALYSKYNTLNTNYDNLNSQYNALKNDYNALTSGTSSFKMNVGDNTYTAQQKNYVPQASLFSTAQQNALTNPAQISNININQPTAPNTNLNTPTINYRPNAQAVYSPYIKNTQLGNLGDIDKSGLSSTAAQANYTPNIQYNNAQADTIKNYYDYTKLQDDMYKGIQTAVNQERELAQDRLSNTMANAGLFRSGLTLANQQQLERSTLDALAKGWGDAAFNVAQLQGDLASRQAELNTNVNLQNAINQLQASTRNAELAADLSKFNAQLQTNVSMQNAQNMLQAKITEYAQKADMLKAQGQLDQAAEFERAKNSLQAQLSNQQKDIELANLNTDIAKTQAGLFQQSNLAGLEARMQQYQTQADLAKTQAALSSDISKYNADIQNAFKTKNYDYLMNAAAQDQEAINQASQFNIQIKNAYDEMAFKWMASLLDKEIRDYQTTMDAFKTAYGATLQYGSDTAKENLNKLGFEKALADRLGLDTSGLFTPTTTTPTTTDTTTSPTDNITNTRSNSFLWDDPWKRMGYESYSDYSNDKA